MGDERQQKKERKREGETVKPGALEQAVLPPHPLFLNAEPAFSFDVDIHEALLIFMNIRIRFLQFVTWVSAICQIIGRERDVLTEANCYPYLCI